MSVSDRKPDSIAGWDGELTLRSSCELFRPLGDIDARDAFGGALLCVDDIPFAVFRAGDLFLRASGTVRSRMEASRCARLVPFPNSALRLHYYRVPSPWLAQRDCLCRFAYQAIEDVRALIEAFPEPPKHRARRIDIPND